MKFSGNIVKKSAMLGECVLIAKRFCTPRALIILVELVFFDNFEATVS